MLVVETIAKIRHAHFIEGKSIKQICGELQLSLNTVREVILARHQPAPLLRPPKRKKGRERRVPTRFRLLAQDRSRW